MKSLEYKRDDLKRETVYRFKVGLKDRLRFLFKGELVIPDWIVNKERVDW